MLFSSFQTCKPSLIHNCFTNGLLFCLSSCSPEHPGTGHGWHVRLASSLWECGLHRYSKPEEIHCQFWRNDILTKSLHQAIHSRSQHNTQQVCSPTTEERLVRSDLLQPSLFARKPRKRSRYPVSPRKTLPGFTVKSRGRTQSNYTPGTITGIPHSLPSEETWQLNNTAFILHFHSN